MIGAYRTATSGVCSFVEAVIHALPDTAVSGDGIESPLRVMGLYQTLMQDAMEQETVLDTYPPDLCLFCETETPFDGWECPADMTEVEIYCDRCGHRKYTLPWIDVPADLRAEIRDLFENAE